MIINMVHGSQFCLRLASSGPLVQSIRFIEPYRLNYYAKALFQRYNECNKRTMPNRDEML
jgi:hypothetical protein